MLKNVDLVTLTRVLRSAMDEESQNIFVENFA